MLRFQADHLARFARFASLANSAHVTRLTNAQRQTGLPSKRWAHGAIVKLTFRRIEIFVVLARGIIIHIDPFLLHQRSVMMQLTMGKSRRRVLYWSRLLIQQLAIRLDLGKLRLSLLQARGQGKISLCHQMPLRAQQLALPLSSCCDRLRPAKSSSAAAPSHLMALPYRHLPRCPSLPLPRETAHSAPPPFP